MWRIYFAFVLLVSSAASFAEVEKNTARYIEEKESPEASGEVKDDLIHNRKDSGASKRMETENREGYSRYLRDEAEGYGYLARHLWDEEVTSPDQEDQADETTMEVTKEGFDTRMLYGTEHIGNGLLARHLWDEETVVLPAGVRMEIPDSAVRPWKFARPLDEVTGEGLLARFLWDDEEFTPATDRQAEAVRDRLVRHLWDEDTRGNGLLAHFLWDKERISSPASVIPLDVMVTDHLPFAGEMMVAQHIWDEESRPAGDTVAGFVWDEEFHPFSTSDEGVQVATIGDLDFYIANLQHTEPATNYVITGHSIADMKAHVGVIGGQVHQEETLVNALQVSLTRRQLQQLSRSVVTGVVKDAQVQTAALKFSAKGDPALNVDGNSVSWTVHNLGKKPLNVDMITADWPQANGALVSVTIADQVFAADAAASPADVTVSQNQVQKNSAATVTLTFAGSASTDQEAYSLQVSFAQELTLDFAWNTSLPLQGKRRDTFFPTLIDADLLHRDGVTGNGVGVAVIDTGAWNGKPIRQNTRGEPRVTAYYDAIENYTDREMSDDNGHGTHIASVIASSKRSVDMNGKRTGSYHGIAPDANLIVVRAFDEEGNGSYMDVIRGIAYVIAHKDEHNIRVLNLSFSGTPMSHYWQDPLNLAVMAAWQAGIVVVVSSGNSGPDPMSIGVPGNVPYVVTVGAMTDHYTPDNLSDDYLATFSSSGPTLEGFVKPEITAPGGHIMGVMGRRTTIAEEHPEFHDGYRYFLMSGTSQASAVAAGVAALMLQQNPELSADDVKCRLMDSARAARRADGSLAYSVFQQGTGLVNAWDAVHSTASGCVNQGLDLEQDLAGEQHFGGPANVDAGGAYVADDHVWTVSEHETTGYFWNTADLSSESNLWNTGYLWNMSELENTGTLWNTADFEANGYLWNLASLEQSGHVWNVGHVWNLNNTENTGHVWNVGHVWNMNDVENTGHVWNVGHVWNLNNSENTGHVWNMSDLANVGQIWNVGHVWNMSSTESSGHVWNVGHVWNLSNTENAGHVWNVGHVWNLNNAENAGHIWNTGNLWNTSVNAASTVAINRWVQQE